MFNVVSNIHWLSVLAAFVAYYLLGALWYLVLFPQPYKVSLGKAHETLQNQSALFVVGPGVCVLVSVLATALLFQALHIASYGDALGLAVVVGVGYLVANTTNIAINPNIPQPFLYSAITSSYHLVGITLTCLLLAALR
ncbi:DUF1761 domain-containing protein [Hymenobacter sp. RP-2-7]|uniref:DUF1761 domain-containing protein n=1 Tax=Hymenobacter polaris TaxID=2682546 RepID=A0A7Y0ADH5_9BACT|nr:DUF1761 domain-containing protein [Hymenobacter polaris]NML65192.1 DUF1761 domain-containing protein [Hymenobacter polaris]